MAPVYVRFGLRLRTSPPRNTSDPLCKAVEWSERLGAPLRFRTRLLGRFPKRSLLDRPCGIGQCIGPLDKAPRESQLEDDLALQEIREVPVRQRRGRDR